MSAYVEVMVKGDRRALIECGNVGGVLLPRGMSADTPATPDDTLSILLRNGATVEGVYGISANRLLLRVEGGRMMLRRGGRSMLVIYLDNAHEIEAQIAGLLESDRGE